MFDKIRDLFSGSAHGQTNNRYQFKIPNGYDVKLGLDMEGFKSRPDICSLIGEENLFGQIYYLVNKDDQHDKLVVYCVDESAEGYRVVDDEEEIKKAETIFACSLFTETHEITDQYLENVHKYMEIEELLPQSDENF